MRDRRPPAGGKFEAAVDKRGLRFLCGEYSRTVRRGFSMIAKGLGEGDHGGWKTTIKRSFSMVTQGALRLLSGVDTAGWKTTANKWLFDMAITRAFSKWYFDLIKNALVVSALVYT
jgi:hypothetical protein